MTKKIFLAFLSVLELIGFLACVAGLILMMCEPSVYDIEKHIKVCACGAAIVLTGIVIVVISEKLKKALGYHE